MRRTIILTTMTLLGLSAFVPAQTYDPAYDSAQVLVDSWYQKFLGRSTGNDPWSGQWVSWLEQGHSPESVLAGILSSDEYLTKGKGTANGFIRVLFRDVVGRNATRAEVQYWLQRSFAQNGLDQQTRQDIAYDLLTHNPGSWSGAQAAPIVVIPRPVIRVEDQERERERHRERDRERDRRDHDYRRPHFPFHP